MVRQRLTEGGSIAGLVPSCIEDDLHQCVQHAMNGIFSIRSQYTQRSEPHYGVVLMFARILRCP